MNFFYKKTLVEIDENGEEVREHGYCQTLEKAVQDMGQFLIDNKKNPYWENKSINILITQCFFDESTKDTLLGKITKN